MPPPSCSGADPDETSAPQFLTGPRLEQALQERTSIAVTGGQLLPLLREISTNARIAVVLDRRVDPDMPLSTETGFAPRLQVLKRILPADPPLDVQSTDRVVLIGPAGSVSRLPVLREWNEDTIRSVQSDATTEGRTVADLQAVRIPFLSEPRKVVVQALQDNGLTLSNPQAIPHDVWNAAQLPDMSLADLCTVILIQFDLALEAGPSAGALRVTAVDALPQYEREYVVGRRQKPRVQEQLGRLGEDLEVRWRGGKAIVRARVDQHVQVESLLNDAGEGTAGQGDPDWVPITHRRFTLTVERANVGQLVRSFRQQGIPIEIVGEAEPAVQSLLQRVVKLDVAGEPAESFFRQAFGGAFSSVVVEDSRVVLSP